MPSGALGLSCAVRLPPIYPDAIPAARFASTVAAHAHPAPFAQQRATLLGLPSDAGVALNHGNPGARLGPAALRAALAGYGVQHAMLGEPASLWDAGDVPASAEGDLAHQLRTMHARVTQQAQLLASLPALPIAIGGGHDLTAPFIAGVVAAHRTSDASRPLATLHIDAHLDVRDTLGSGMPFRVIAQSLAPVSMAVFGLNPLVNTREHAEFFTREAKGVLLGSEAGLTRWLASLPPRCMLCCSFDVDALDASCAPGVSARNPQGLSVAQAASLLRTIASDARLASLDFMELCPPRDVPAWTAPGCEPGITARAVAHLLLGVLHTLASQPAST